MDTLTDYDVAWSYATKVYEIHRARCTHLPTRHPVWVSSDQVPPDTLMLVGQWTAATPEDAAEGYMAENEGTQVALSPCCYGPERTTMTIALTAASELTRGTITPYGVILEVLAQPTIGMVRLTLPESVKSFPARLPVITLGTVPEDLVRALLDEL